MPAMDMTKVEMMSFEVGTWRFLGVCLISQKVWRMSRPELYVSFVEFIQAQLMMECIHLCSPGRGFGMWCMWLSDIRGLGGPLLCSEDGGWQRFEAG